LTSPTGQPNEPFGRFDDVRPYLIWPGVLARAVRGERMGLALVELDSNTEVAEHTHPNEQVGFVLQGIFSFTIAGETRELHPGETYVIPASVPHSGRAGSGGAVVIDVFSPPRDDWERLERGDASKAAWP